MKTAVITGATGQDGAYLCEWLLKEGYTVIGITRDKQKVNKSRLRYLNIENKVVFEACDLTNIDAVQSLLRKYSPDEVYNLAAQSSVAQSFEYPVPTISYNILSVLNLAEGIRVVNKDIRLCQASSSEMFGRVSQLPITEESPVRPQSPYAISKAAGYWTIKSYRESYALFACNIIFFTHESYLRPDTFFVKKIIKKSIEIFNGKLDVLKVGNIDLKRDLGYAPEYVKALWLSLQQSTADDYIICSGQSTSLRDIIYYVFDKLKISHDKVVSDNSLYRPVDIEDVYGDNTKARRKLNWNYSSNFFQVLDKLVDEELANYSG